MKVNTEHTFKSISNHRKVLHKLHYYAYTFAHMHKCASKTVRWTTHIEHIGGDCKVPNVLLYSRVTFNHFERFEHVLECI